MTTPSPNPDDVTTRLREEDLRAMIDGCKGVTPGPWECRADGPVWDMEVTGRLTGEHVHMSVGGRRNPRIVADANHIARLDPQTVSAMASELLSLRRHLAERDAALRTIASSSPVPLSEAEVSPIMFKRFNDCMKVARSALGEPQ